MNELSLFNGNRMTISELSIETGVSLRTVHNAVQRVFPNLMVNGKTTYLDESQVAEISKELKIAHNSDLATTGKVISTDLEMEEKAFEVMAWMKRKIDDQRMTIETQAGQLAIAAPKVESFNALMRSEQTMSITQAAKHFGLHPKTEVFPYLRDRGYLTMKDLPTQSAIDAGYLALRESKCPDGDVRPQSVVLASQLETWRTRVIPQIKEWVKLV